MYYCTYKGTQPVPSVHLYQISYILTSIAHASTVRCHISSALCALCTNRHLDWSTKLHSGGGLGFTDSRIKGFEKSDNLFCKYIASKICLPFLLLPIFQRVATDVQQRSRSFFPFFPLYKPPTWRSLGRRR